MVPKTSRLTRRFGRAGMAGLLAAALAVAVAPQSAQAMSASTVTASKSAYVDSQHPDATHPKPGASVPVGRIGADVNRAYYVFDLSGFAGRTIGTVTLSGAETQATDCAHRSVELWTTGPLTKSSTWSHQPAWLRKISTAGPIAGQGCPASYTEWDAGAAVQAAVAAGQTTLTLGLRNTDEANAKLGRHFSSALTLSVESAAAPNTPVVVSNGGKPCATTEPYAWLSSALPKLIATVSDPDGLTLSTTFATWPVDDPQQRTTATITGSPSGSNTVGVPGASLADGGTYGWAAQATDESGLTSGWSPTCYFHIDTTFPAVAPTITVDPATAFAEGIPAPVTFGASAVGDIAGYNYSWQGYTGGTYVAAPQLGGPVTVVITPPGAVHPSLAVYSVDRAGNFSPMASAGETVTQTHPLLTVLGSPAAGETMQLQIQSGVHVTGYDSVVSYSYTDNGQPAVTVPAGSDGNATAAIVLAGGSNDIKVTGTSSNGWVSPASEVNYYAGEWPSVTSADWPQDAATGTDAGQAGTFTFTNHLAGATAFAYSFDVFDVQTVPIGADGKATITWTPTANGSQTIWVYSTAPDGTQSDVNTYSFTVGAS